MILSSNVKLIAVALRILTLASRFLFIFFLARLLGPSQLGIYGLFTATIGYALYLVGLDFYTYTTRELLKKDKVAWGGILKNQIALALALYLIFFPLLSFLFIKEILPIELFGWYFLLLVMEHVNQESGRLLVAISEQLMASVILFVRQGIWAICIVLLMILLPTTRTLNYIFAAWGISGAFAITLSYVKLKNLKIGGWNSTVDWPWIFNGLKVCVPFVMSTLALQAVFTIDRYWLNSLAPLEIVGSYVLFVGISSTLLAFLDAGVFSFSYPLLIRAYQSNDSHSFRLTFRKLCIQTLCSCFMFSIVAVITLPYLLKLLSNPIYLAQIKMFPWLLMAMVLNAFSLVPHYALYAQGRDKAIIFSHFASFIFFVLVTFIVSRFLPVQAVPISVCFTFLFLFILKSFALLAFSPKNYIDLFAKKIC